MNLLSTSKQLTTLLKLELIVFSLPWSISAVILAYWYNPVAFQEHFFSKCMSIILALVFGRALGMGLNRLIDASIDGANPRTKHRLMPCKKVSRQVVYLFCILCIGVLLIACYAINNAILQALPLVLGLLYVYSYLKRQTVACHFVLGFILALVPLLSWMAFSESISISIISLSVANFAIIASSDIIYSFSDYQFDKSYHLYSLPARYGKVKALYIAGCLHVLFLLSLVFLVFLLKSFFILLAMVLSCLCISYFYYLLYKKPVESWASISFSLNKNIAGLVLLSFLGEWMYPLWVE